MLRINDKIYNGNAYYKIDASGEIVADISDELSDEQISEIKNATLLQKLDDRDQSVDGEYRLIGWRFIENTNNGIRVSWQTYVVTDVEQLRQDNEDLTSAILELAAIIGGDNG